MKTFQDYIDQYGMSGYKVGSSQYAPLVAMLRDEVANPGTTQLSGLDRDSLVKLQASLPTGETVEQFMGNADLPFMSLRFDGSKVPVYSGNLAQIQTQMDA